MKNVINPKSWEQILGFPIPGRANKPRTSGITMIIDKGLGLAATGELLEIASDYIDFVKLGFGTSALYTKQLLEKKIDLVRSYGVDIYPGGTFFEIAWLQNKVQDYLAYARELGFSAIEISDGTVDIASVEKSNYINRAKAMGFKVLTEIGKKNADDAPETLEFVNELKKFLASCADFVIVEGRESGKGIGIYDCDGNIKRNEFSALINSAYESKKIMWEAPLKNQQHELISLYGPNVNLGNISPGEILSLEALRLGLRGDTLRDTLNKGDV